MSSDYIKHLPLTKWFFDRYEENHSACFPGGGKTHYDEVLLNTDIYLNTHVHPTVQERAPLRDSGIYLTDHGPKHIEVVLSRASRLVRSVNSIRSEASRDKFYEPDLDPYEIFLLVMGIHFHDVGNMYGRIGHEKKISEVMDRIGALQPLAWHEKTLISQIATCHGGKIEGNKDTIQSLQAGEADDGGVRYRPQLVASILRLADELADEYSRADTFGLMKPEELPATCLIFHKYAQALRVSLKLLAGQIRLQFLLGVDDLRQPFKKMGSAGVEVDVYLLDEIYERTLKTYYETVYCGRYMRGLDTHLHEVFVEINIYESTRHPFPYKSFSYIIGDSEYPEHPGSTQDALRRLARGFRDLPSGEAMAKSLPGIEE